MIARLTIASAVLTMALGCDTTTDPTQERPDPELNTLIVSLKGGAHLEGVVQALGSFQQVNTGPGEGVHINATTNIQGLPFAIHLPGRSSTGKFTLGQWDPSRDLVRADTVLWVGRKAEHLLR